MLFDLQHSSSGKRQNKKMMDNQTKTHTHKHSHERHLVRLGQVSLKLFS